MNPLNNGAPRVLIIAPHGSYRTAAFIQAAEQLAIKTLIASDGKHSLISAYAQGVHLDFTKPDSLYAQLLNAIQDYNVVGVIATDDYTTELAARIAQALDLPHNDPAAVLLTQRKDLARVQLERHGVSKPVHWRLDLESDLAPQLDSIVYPVVVKPVSLSGSRGVIRANDQTELLNAVDRIRRLLHSMNDLPADSIRYVLVEEFIAGDEIAVEGMLYQGELTLLTVFDKPEPLNGPYFEESYYISPSKLPGSVKQQVSDVLQQACNAYGLSDGPIHAECRLRDGKIYVIEVAARTIGGLCARLLNVGTGHSLEEIVLTQAMGQRLVPEPQQQAAGVLMIPIPKAGILKRVEGLLAAQAVAHIDEISIQIREGHELIPLPDGASYLGFIFAYADTTDEVEYALRTAHAHLNFVIAPIWKLSKAG
ncbi:hypothetical protein MNBD_GAMMA21-2997 [hydrothermal vent metagenome]|uniref:ATP-grasp domain-containing protein n=1 Tax=hydrothermal vent metagenome TaxID=652676 RepID=A0A3B0ZMJ1_9ZZZZ